MKNAFLGIVFAALSFMCSAGFGQEAAKPRLLCRIDCCQELPAEKYFQHGDVRIVDSPIGKYREAEGKPLSRFGFRFPIENVGKPHLVVVRYPDDKRRMMCMMEGTCYDLTEGVFTDWSQPLSGKIQEIRRIYWPRWTDCSLVLMTWSTGEPAAASEIEVYELPELSPVNLPEPVGSSPRRTIGIEFEDPCGKGMSLGALSPEDWQDRMIQYMRYTGQNLLTYPVVWYHGPHYPSDTEPCQDLGSVTAPDRKMYSFSTTKPTDWVNPMLKRFEKEGLEFQASMTLLRLGSLMKEMNIDLASIQGGAETYNNMRSDNKVQDGTQDWTVPYNVMEKPVDLTSKQKIWAYGERNDTCSKGPMFNPIHPKVQQAIVNVVREIAQKYGSSPAFRGIALNVWHATICWFGTPEIGYDDYTVNLFSLETGIEIPVDAKAVDRFSKRYDFLMKNHRQRWLDWRCAKIAELFRAMRDAMVKVQPDLQLTVNLWTETTMSQLLGFPDGPEYQLYARKSTYDIYRDGGFDAKLLQNEPGIAIDYVFVPARDRDCWGTDGVEMPLEKLCMFRDHDFLDETTLKTIALGPTPKTWIFDSWGEAWGEHKGFPCDGQDPQVSQFAKAWSVSPERISHMNSEYPKDGFWWNWQFRITPQFPSGIHYMEHYAHAVAELDALEITRGGLFLHTGHSELIQPFARAYRALPAKKFETVGNTTDPVAVRTLLCDNQRYLYLVNRDYYPVAVELNLKKEAGKAMDLSTGESIEAPARWTVTLSPYQLRSFSLSPDTQVQSFETEIPGEIAKSLDRRLEASLRQTDLLPKSALPVGTEAMVAKLKDAHAKKQYAWLRRGLDSYILRKCAERAGKIESK